MNDALTLASFWEAWPLFGDSALAGALAGAVLGLLGVYVVLRRLVFLSAAISQIAGLGVALAFFTGLLGPAAGAAVATLLAVFVVMLTRAPAQRDATLGVLFLLGSAGTLALASRITAELHDIKTLLFGVAVAVAPEDFSQLAWVALPILALHLWWARGFSLASFDPESARVARLPVRLLDAVLFVTLALMISTSTRILGALPTFAFSVLPALAAVALAPNLGVALLLGLLLGALTGFGGYVASYLYSLPVPAGQTLVGLGLVLVAVAVGRLIRR